MSLSDNRGNPACMSTVRSVSSLLLRSASSKSRLLVRTMTSSRTSPYAIVRSILRSFRTLAAFARWEASRYWASARIVSGRRSPHPQAQTRAMCAIAVDDLMLAYYVLRRGVGGYVQRHYWFGL